MTILVDLRPTPELCKTCLSLDYEEIYDDRLRRKRGNYCPPFPLKRILPGNLISVLEKMNQTAFTRMRRTSIAMYNFICKNRHNIRVCLFHNCAVSIVAMTVHHHTDVSIRFQPHDCRSPTISRIEAHRLRYKSPQRATLYFGKFTQCVTLLDREVHISLTEWAKNKEFRRELIGHYHSSLLHVNGGMSENEDDYEIVGAFLQWAGMTGKTLELFSFSDDSSILKIAEMVKPTGLYFEMPSFQYKSILSHDVFKNVKFLMLDYNGRNVDLSVLCNQLEILQVSCGDETMCRTLLHMIKRWIDGNSTLKKLSAINVSLPNILDQFELTPCDTNDALTFNDEKQFPLLHGREYEAFYLHSTSGENKAFIAKRTFDFYFQEL